VPARQGARRRRDAKGKSRSRIPRIRGYGGVSCLLRDSRHEVTVVYRFTWARRRVYTHAPGG
jgi:hypothetical protein